MDLLKSRNDKFVYEIKLILEKARQRVYSSINREMVDAYWEIGKRIVEEEQQGEKRAGYGKEILKILSKELFTEFGKGFDERELRRIRQFYLTFPIRDTLRPELSWSHYRLLIRVTNEKARTYYMLEASNQYWSYRTLERNYSTLYYERLLSSNDKGPVIKEMTEKTNRFEQDQLEFIKNPYVLEFLQLPVEPSYTEAQFE